MLQKLFFNQDTTALKRRYNLLAWDDWKRGLAIPEITPPPSYVIYANFSLCLFYLEWLNWLNNKYSTIFICSAETMDSIILDQIIYKAVFLRLPTPIQILLFSLDNYYYHIKEGGGGGGGFKNLPEKCVREVNRCLVTPHPQSKYRF